VGAAWWTRTDGWSARFVASDGNLLTLDPPMADLKRLATTLPPEDERALSSWIQSQEWQVRPQRQVAALAAAAGEAGTFAPPTGERQGRPQLVREGGSYRITYRVAPPFAAFANLTFVIEDTLAVADLAFERRFTRTVDLAGVVLDEAEHRLISRKEADPAVFAKLMADVDAPPAHWRVKRLTPAEVAAMAVARWKTLRPH
jgi:hypothetical protein